MSISLFSHNSSGNSLTQHPDWEQTDSYQISLSGARLEMTLPRNYSTEHETILPENKNLYDDSLYNDWPSFVLLDIHWKYAARKILWQEILGTLQVLAVIHKSSAELRSTNAHSSEFEAIVTRDLRESFEIEDGEMVAQSGIELPRKYHFVDINNTPWLRYTVIGGTSNADMLSFSTPLTEQHYITVIFRIAGHQSYDTKDWHNTCIDDIEKIINSFKLNLPSK